MWLKWMRVKSVDVPVVDIFIDSDVDNDDKEAVDGVEGVVKGG